MIEGKYCTPTQIDDETMNNVSTDYDYSVWTIERVPGRKNEKKKQCIVRATRPTIYTPHGEQRTNERPRGGEEE